MMIETVRKVTTDVLDQLGFAVTVDVSPVDEETFNIDLKGDDLGILIGYHGETLASLRHILGLILYKRLGKWLHLNLDADGYRKMREEKLLDLAKRTADKVRFLQTEVALPPMPAFERRLIHLALAEEVGVTTESLGEGWERRVVVKPR